MDVIEESITDPNFWINWNKTNERYKKFEPVKDIQLILLSQEQIRRMSVCEITTTTLYEKSLPRAFGINDIRMGTVDRKLRCGTCMQGIVECNGHPGHMELAMPVYHIAYISYVLKTLRCICPRCFRVVTIAEDKTMAAILRKYASDPKERFNTLAHYLKNKKQCQHPDCKLFLPKYSQSGLGIKREWLQKAKLQFVDSELEKEEQETLLKPLTVQEVINLFEMVDPINFDYLGLSGIQSHPVNFIIQTLLVPPPIIRPSIMFSESSRTRGQDDLTHKLQEILKTSNKLRKIMTIESPLKTQLLELLQLLVATYMNNECSGIKVPLKKRSGLPEKCIFKRFKGKKGRGRGNLMGKRVDFSARTVISPDCVMDVDEIGIPFSIAMILTFPETVNSINIHELTKKVHIGYDSLEGAKSITKLDGSVMYLEYCKNPKSIRLQLGWQVERYLRNGDYVLFNRQPSLRKKSIMAHKVRLMPGKTFRLNLSCTGPYNGAYC